MDCGIPLLDPADRPRLVVAGSLMRSLPQVPLPFILAPYSDPDTSREAAKAIEGDVARLRARVLHFISSQGAWGATDDEIERVTGIIGSTVRPRRGELRARGLVKDSGERRKTRSGRNAVVWVAT